MLSTGALVLALIFSVVATLLAFIFIVPENRRSRLNTIGMFLHDLVNFKQLFLETFIQVLYVLATAFVILFGFFELFDIRTATHYYNGREYTTLSAWNGGYGLLIMVVGPIAVRLAFELLMMLILLVKNVISINHKLSSQNQADSQGSFSSVAPSASASEPPVNDGWTCLACGATNPRFAISCHSCGASRHPQTSPAKSELLKNGGWRCPACGAFNASYVGSCGCGEPRPAQTSPTDNDPVNGGWRCPACGAVNADYVGSCGCGEPRP